MPLQRFNGQSHVENVDLVLKNRRRMKRGALNCTCWYQRWCDVDHFYMLTRYEIDIFTWNANKPLRFGHENVCNSLCSFSYSENVRWFTVPFQLVCVHPCAHALEWSGCCVSCFFAQINSILTSHFLGKWFFVFLCYTTFHHLQKCFHTEILSKVIWLPSEIRKLVKYCCNSMNFSWLTHRIPCMGLVYLPTLIP